MHVWVGCTVYFRPGNKDKNKNGTIGNGQKSNWKRKRTSQQAKQNSSMKKADISQLFITQPTTSPPNMSLPPNLSQPNMSQPNMSQPNTSQPNLSQPNLSQPNLSHQCLCGKICKSSAGLKSHKRSSKCPQKSNYVMGNTDNTDLMLSTLQELINTKKCMSQPPPCIDDFDDSYQNFPLSQPP